MNDFAGSLGYAGCKMTRLRSRSKPARPYIWRLIILIFLWNLACRYYPCLLCRASMIAK